MKIYLTIKSILCEAIISKPSLNTILHNTLYMNFTQIDLVVSPELTDANMPTMTYKKSPKAKGSKALSGTSIGQIVSTLLAKPKPVGSGCGEWGWMPTHLPPSRTEKARKVSKLANLLYEVHRRSRVVRRTSCHGRIFWWCNPRRAQHKTPPTAAAPEIVMLQTET